MSRYLVGIFFCLILSLAYTAFRYEMFEELRARHIRKRDIRQKQKGALNFWFYTELEKAYGLGKYGILLRLYPIVAGSFTVLHITFGWIEGLAVLDLILASLTALYLSIITMAACMGRNRRLFGSSLPALGVAGDQESRGKGTVAGAQVQERELVGVLFIYPRPHPRRLTLGIPPAHGDTRPSVNPHPHKNILRGNSP